MTATHEDHLHLLVCIDRLNAAWRTLKEISVHPGHSLVGPAFRYALVEYATAFTVSRAFTVSKGNEGKTRKLKDSCVPAQYLSLHKRVMDARNQVHAHADLTSLNATLHVTCMDGRKHVSQVQNYIHGLEELPNLAQILDMVEGILDNVYAMERDSRLPIEP